MKLLKSVSMLLLAILVLFAGTVPAYAVSPMPNLILLAPPASYDADVQTENRRIVVRWTPDLPEGAYHQLEKTWPDGSVTYHSPITNGMYTDNGVVYSAIYKYRIREVMGDRKSAWTPYITKTVPNMPKPTDLIVKAKAESTGDYAQLSWKNNVNLDCTTQITRYNPDGTTETFVTAAGAVSYQDRDV